MSEINTLRGLNRVSVDFRPEIAPIVEKTGNANPIQLEGDAVPGEALLEKANAKSVVQVAFPLTRLSPHHILQSSTNYFGEK